MHELNFSKKLSQSSTRLIHRCLDIGNKIRRYMGHTQKHFCVLKAKKTAQNHCWPSATSKLGFKWTKPYIRFMKRGINKLSFRLCHNVLFSQEGGNEKFCVNSRLQTTGCWLPKAWRSQWQRSCLLVTCHPHPEHWGCLAECHSSARKCHTLCLGSAAGSLGDFYQVPLRAASS